MAGANDAKYPPLPNIAYERSNRMWVLQAQAVVHVGAGVVHVGTGKNMMNQMATFCLGERAHPLRHGQAKPTRCKWLQTCLIMYLLSDLWPSWTVSTRSSTLATTALTTSSAAWTITPRIPGVRWLRHFGSYPYTPTNGSWTILTKRRHTGFTETWSATASFGWPSRRPIWTSPSLEAISTIWRGWRRTWHRDKLPCCGWRTPLNYEGKVFVTLGQLFDDVRHQKLAVGIPCCPDYSKQEEIVTHLAKLARDKRNDTVRLPASMPEAKQVLNPSHPWYSYDDSAWYGWCARMAPSDRTEQDPTQMSAPESTDTEMYQVLEKDLLISSDYQAGLARTVAQVLEVASSVESTRDVRNVQFREPDEEEEEIHHTPGTRDEGRGQSILKKMTVNTSTGTIPRQSHTIGDIPSGVGSPLAKHPGNSEPSGDFSLRSGFQSQLQMFQSDTKKMYDWYTSLKQLYPYVKRSSSRKRERQTQPKPLMETPTQSPLQKTGRLQSVVTVVQKEQPKRDRSTQQDWCDDDAPACWCTDGTFETMPYHLIGSPETIAKQFVLCCTDRFSRDDFEDEVNDFGNVFGHRTAFIARYCMAMAVYFEVAWFVVKGGYFRTFRQKWRRWRQDEARPFLPRPRNPWSAQESMYQPDVWSGGVTSWRLCSFGRMRRHPSSTVALWGTTVKCFYT